MFHSISRTIHPVFHTLHLFVLPVFPHVSCLLFVLIFHWTWNPFFFFYILHFVTLSLSILQHNSKQPNLNTSCIALCIAGDAVLYLLCSCLIWSQSPLPNKHWSDHSCCLLQHMEVHPTPCVTPAPLRTDAFIKGRVTTYGSLLKLKS